MGCGLVPEKHAFKHKFASWNNKPFGGDLRFYFLHGVDSASIENAMCVLYLTSAGVIVSYTKVIWGFPAQESQLDIVHPCPLSLKAYIPMSQLLLLIAGSPYALSALSRVSPDEKSFPWWLSGQE